MGKRENEYQAGLIRRIKDRLGNCIVLKNDPNYMQGVPDLSVFYSNRWATLEVKRSLEAPHQPNQDYYVTLMNTMSYSAFICPENEEEILDAMEHALTS